MKKNTTKIRVRYSETDQMGVVYHGNYAQFFEIGRTEWLRDMGVTYKKMETTCSWTHQRRGHGAKRSKSKVPKFRRGGWKYRYSWQIMP